MIIQSTTSQDMIIQPTNMNPPKENDELGQDEFLNLLMTQLEYQDPLEPMDDTEFISQLAEFSALEQMQSMNGYLNSMHASSMMGKTVVFNSTDEITGLSVLEEGIVESTIYKNGKSYLVVNEKEIDPQDVIEVSQPKEDDEDNTAEETSEV